MRGTYWALALLLVSAACNRQESADRSSVAVAKKPPAVTTEQIAYTYTYSFKIPVRTLPLVRADHVALCDRLGARCHIVSMESAGDGQAARADLTLAVDAALARSFGDALVRVVEQHDGATLASAIQGENLTKQIVDVEARLRGRQALADRLLAIVRTHKGSIADLTAAEKSLADVQQEIDTARSELVGARGRVAQSTIQVSYTGRTGFGGFSAPIGDSFSNFASILGWSISTVITVLAALLPWGLLLGSVAFIVRWWKGRGSRQE